MGQATHDFTWPFLVTLSAGLAIYFIQFYRQRSATRKAIIGEINLLLRQCDDYYKYFCQDSHEWLREGPITSGAPYFARSSYKVYSAMLPNLHLLTSQEVLKIIEFYGHYENCESLIEILFGRIRQQEQLGKDVTSKQVELTKKRVMNIVEALADALQSTNRRIENIDGLALAYRMEPASAFGQKRSMQSA